MEQKRQHVRIEYETPVEIDDGGNRQPGTTINISQGGALITTSPIPEFGARVTLYLELPGVQDTVEIKCTVRWRSDNEIGVQFDMLRPIEVWAINKLRKS